MEQNDRILRLPKVMERVGLKKTAIYERVKDGSFPQPLRMGTHATGWLDSEISAWIKERMNERPGANDCQDKSAA